MKTLLLLFLVLSSLVKAEASWFRDPAISPDGTQVIFTAGGDLYLVSTEGGVPRQLTQHERRDHRPVWSPDGAGVAFASKRAGNDDVYYLVLETGELRRLTYHSANDLPSAFTPDGERIVFSSLRQDPAISLEIPSRNLGETYEVPVAGGRVTQLLPGPAEAISFSADGRFLLYHDRKGYEDPFRKGHRSSVARDLWRYEIATGEYQKVTDFEGEDRHAVWDGSGAFYYLSERGGTFNIWHKKFHEEEPVVVTNFQRHPVRSLSISDTKVLCFSWHGSLYLKRRGEEPAKIEVRWRRDYQAQQAVVNYGGQVQEMSASKDGKEIAFIARGEVFVSSVEHGTTRQITETAAQERSVNFHPNGKSLVYASERDGSWNLYQMKLGREEEEFHRATVLEEEALLEIDEETFQPAWSPDGSRIAFLRNRTQLCVMEVATGRILTLLDGSRSYSYQDGDLPFSWSPDGNHLLFMLLQDGRWVENIVMVAADGSGEPYDLSRNGYYDMLPAWGWDGEGVTWISNRHGRKAHGSWGTELDVYGGFLTARAQRVFRMSKAERDRFEEAMQEKGKEDGAEDDERTEDDQTERKWDLFNDEEDLDPESAPERQVRLTARSSDLEAYVLSRDGKQLYSVSTGAEEYEIWKKDFYEGEEKRIGSTPKKSDRDPVDLSLSEDGETLFLLAAGKLFQVSTADGKVKAIGASGVVRLDLAAEREQMFEHVWRQVREKFHRKDLHGVDWEFYRKEYRKLLPAIDHQADFAELLSEMLGELDASHTGAFYRPKFKAPEKTASLGVIYSPSYQGEGIRIDEVLSGSPLDLVDAEVVPGTLIRKLNGQEILAGENFYPLLEGLAGQPVLLELEGPEGGELQDQVIKPISLAEERELLYQRWIRRMESKAEELSDGQIGWAHVRGMNDGAFREFFSRVYGYHGGRRALVVDTRFNGGGWLTEDLTTFLSGQQFLHFYPRGKKVLGGAPIFRWNKPSAVLMSEGNYSDAHLFPYAYQALGIGKLVGMPVPGTGTAVWWERLLDPSLVFGIPQVSTIDLEGNYLENTQLEPDIKVAALPEDRLAGRDRQLEAAVKELMKLPEAKEWPLPE